ncbi:VanZ family protein [Streptomyces sp. NPDC059785]|uniref:VanZ family protein n=1 Tax=unclassified Streptomyces TaxID=2593676 RepID=UPI00365A8A9F
MARTALGLGSTRLAKTGRRSSAASRDKRAPRGKRTSRDTTASRSRRASRAAAASEETRRGLPLPVRLLVMLLAFAAMVGFAAALARLTLEPSPASEALTHNNMHPGRSLHAYLSQPALRDAVKQVGGNVLLGVPFGVLLPVLAPRTRGLLRITFLTAAVMLLVELVQGALITGRAFDIDDVILNTTGALIGYLLLGRRLGRAVHPRRKRGLLGRRTEHERR